jgi:hypothetical protein
VSDKESVMLVSLVANENQSVTVFNQVVRVVRTKASLVPMLKAEETSGNGMFAISSSSYEVIIASTKVLDSIFNRVLVN